MNTLASDKQTQFVAKLMAERDYSNLQAANVQTSVEAGLTKAQASMLITLLLECPKVAQKIAQGVSEGFYVHDDRVYRVQKSKSTGNLYAKVLTPTVFGKASWEYAPGAIKALTGAERLSLETAVRFGHHYGVCMVCGRTLSDPKSVEAGIGPICASRL